MDPNQITRPYVPAMGSHSLSGPQGIVYDPSQQVFGGRFPQPSQPTYRMNPPFQSQPFTQDMIQEKNREIERLNSLLEAKNNEIRQLNKGIDAKYTQIEEQKQTIEGLKKRVEIIGEEKDFLSDRLSVVESRLDPSSKWNPSHLPDLNRLINEYKQSIGSLPYDFGRQQILEKCEQINKVVYDIFYSQSPYLSSAAPPLAQPQQSRFAVAPRLAQTSQLPYGPSQQFGAVGQSSFPPTYPPPGYGMPSSVRPRHY